MTKPNPAKTSLVNLDKVVLVGRANVGKSTLFNRLAEKGLALTSTIAGTTRDYQETDVAWRGRRFTLIDTGGFNIDKQSPLEKQILNKARQAIGQAKLIILVVDSKQGWQPADLNIYREIKKTNKPIILAINKADQAAKWDALILEFSQLGINEPQPVSGINGIGSGDLLDKIVSRIASPPQPDSESSLAEKKITLAIIGQPNVGKSSLINAILKKDKQIVSPQPHTTRDAQAISLTYKNKKIVLIDTAGIRRRVEKRDVLEKFSIDKALKKLQTAHIAILVLDISRPLTFQDRHLTEAVIKSGSSIIIIANKWDLVIDKDEKTIYKYTDYVHNFFPYLTWAPIIFTSATQEIRTDKILDLALSVYQERFRELSDSTLNHFLKKMLLKHAPSRGKGVAHPYLYYIRQVDVNPPAFEVKIKYKKSLHASYLRFLENNLRAEFKFIGTPLRLFVTSVK